MPQEKTNIKTDSHDIYDRMFKRILTLSNKAVIRFVNGVFDTSYDDDSKITYNWTEFVDDDTKKVLADTIITVNESDSFHLEAQMYKDNHIVLRIIEYGYKHALRSWTNIPLPSEESEMIQLDFPKQVIIYLDAVNSPSEYKVRINFGKNGAIDYRIPVLTFQDEDITTIKERNLVILLPFKLIKLRKKIETARTNENISQLSELYEDDIIATIDDSFATGNITDSDRNILVHLTKKLFKHLYQSFDELKEMIAMHDESLDLEIDKYLDAIEEYENKLSEKDAEIERLKAENAALKSQAKSTS